jgi:hypothetical protein
MMRFFINLASHRRSCRTTHRSPHPRPKRPLTSTKVTGDCHPVPVRRPGRHAHPDRVAGDRPFFSGKHHCHGMNLQVMGGPAGQLLWVSGALPGSVHDKKAAWTWGTEDQLAAAGLPALADKGYQGGRAQRPSGTRESPRQGPLPDDLADTASQVPHPGGRRSRGVQVQIPVPTRPWTRVRMAAWMRRHRRRLERQDWRLSRAYGTHATAPRHQVLLVWKSSKPRSNERETTRYPPVER